MPAPCVAPSAVVPSRSERKTVVEPAKQARHPSAERQHSRRGRPKGVGRLRARRAVQVRCRALRGRSPGDVPESTDRLQQLEVHDSRLLRARSGFAPTLPCSPMRPRLDDDDVCPRDDYTAIMRSPPPSCWSSDAGCAFVALPVQQTAREELSSVHEQLRGAHVLAHGGREARRRAHRAESLSVKQRARGFTPCPTYNTNGARSRRQTRKGGCPLEV